MSKRDAAVAPTIPHSVLVEQIIAARPRIVSESKTAFNRIMMALVTNMRKVFPDDPSLKTLEGVCSAQIAKGGGEMALVLFARELYKPSGTGTVADKIVNMDQGIIVDPVTGIPLLKSINIAEKWPKLSPRNQAVVWDCLQRMVTASFSYLIAERGDPEDLLLVCADPTSNSQALKNVIASIMAPPSQQQQPAPTPR